MDVSISTFDDNRPSETLLDTGNSLKLAITICATPSYQYAMLPQAQRVFQALQMRRGHDDQVNVILVTGEKCCGDINKISERYKELLGVPATVLRLPGLDEGHKNYKEQAQLNIAQMRQAAFDAARAWQADFCWSLDSDVLPRPDSLALMLWSLQMPGNVYQVATCPYPSQGGGGFLGGRGTPQRPILPDFYDDERDVPADLRKKKADAEAAWQALHKRNDWKNADERNAAFETQLAILREIDDDLKKCPPTGNVFKCNAEFGWKRRGWLQNAYPEIGWGAVVPTDWCGFGCTLMSREALLCADFYGYDGKGTEDLFVVWRRWHQAGYRINVITHSPCDHVIRNPGWKEGVWQNCPFVHQAAYFETEGECVGHLRYQSRPWYDFSPGERYRLEGKAGEKVVDSKSKV